MLTCHICGLAASPDTHIFYSNGNVRVCNTQSAMRPPVDVMHTNEAYSNMLDDFAKAALHAMNTQGMPPENIAKRAYDIARRMMVERAIFTAEEERAWFDAELARRQALIP
jgi:ribosome-binding protein aMBF1 (putative translation factor)